MHNLTDKTKSALLYVCRNHQKQHREAKRMHLEMTILTGKMTKSGRVNLIAMAGQVIFVAEAWQAAAWPEAYSQTNEIK